MSMCFYFYTTVILHCQNHESKYVYLIWNLVSKKGKATWSSDAHSQMLKKKTFFKTQIHRLFPSRHFYVNILEKTIKGQLSQSIILTALSFRPFS